MGIIRSSGLAIVYNKKLLLLHQTGGDGSVYSIPKGKIEKGESKLDAAIRETFEETGIKVPLHLIGNEGARINYKKGGDGSGRVYKTVDWFEVLIDDLSDIGLDSEVIPKENLSLREVDWGGFMGSDDIDKKMFWRLKPIAAEIGLI